jgi:hypothetical protein
VGAKTPTDELLYRRYRFGLLPKKPLAGGSFLYMDRRRLCGKSTPEIRTAVVFGTNGQDKPGAKNPLIGAYLYRDFIFIEKDRENNVLLSQIGRRAEPVTRLASDLTDWGEPMTIQRGKAA